MAINRLVAIAAASSMALAMEAAGQLSIRPLDRPSDQGPSARIGQIGGQSTRMQVTSLRERSGQPLEQAVNSRFLRSRASPIPSSSLAPAFLPFRQEPMSPSAQLSSTYFAANIGPSTMDLADISGMSWFTSHSIPIVDDLYPEILVTGTPYLPRVDERSTFSKYFDLQPYKPQAAGPVPEIERTYVDILEEGSLQRLDIAEDRAIAAFREGTSGEDTSERREMLIHAHRLLIGVSRLKPESSLPYLLIAHAGLEREQLVSAADALVQFAMREPRYFLEGGGVEKYYGDPSRIDVLARRYLFTLTGASADPRYYVVQSYAAWLRKDWARLRAALDTMERANRASEQPDPRLERYGFALLAAAQAVE